MHRAAAALGALLLAAGCRSVPQGVPVDPGDPRFARLVGAWNEGARERRALRGTLRLAVDAGEGAFRVRSRQRVALERPARLRVEILGLFDQSVGLLVTDGERYSLFRADDRSTETGAVHPDLLYEQTYLDVTPEEAIGLLLGAPLLDPTLRTARAFELPGGGLLLDRADDRGALRERVEFDGAGRLRLLELWHAYGALLWRARFDGYRPLPGASFAHAIELEVEAGASRAELTLGDVELNPELPEGLFAVPGGEVP